jgi:hypothetical protein
MLPDLWIFEANFDLGRRTLLEAPTTIHDIHCLIRLEMSAISYDVECGQTGGFLLCKRPVFNLSVSAETFDVFFNGPYGYRAQYLASPEIGLACNHVLIQMLQPGLLEASKVSDVPHEMTAEVVAKSLAAGSAKVWVYEDDFPFQNLTQDLAIPTWIAAAALGCQKARWGLCAPLGSRLQIKGAFLDKEGNEVVPADKIRRNSDINSYGFS